MRKSTIILLELLFLAISISIIYMLEDKFQMLRIIRFVPQDLVYQISMWESPAFIISTYLGAFTTGGLSGGALFSQLFLKPKRVSSKAPTTKKRPIYA